MIWIKGKLNFNGREIINDNLWHSIVDENNMLFVDGKTAITQSDVICGLLNDCKNKKEE